MRDFLKQISKTAPPLALAFLLLAGCAPGRQEVSVRSMAGQKSIGMTAGSYYFEPAVILASPGDQLFLAIENVSGADHNFTLEEPDGEIMLSIDLPGNSTREVEVRLEQSGAYRYYCDITFHPTLGMRGRIEVR